MIGCTKTYGLAGGWLTPPQVMVCPLCDGTWVMKKMLEG